MKKLLALVALAAFLVTLTVGCGGETSKPAGGGPKPSSPVAPKTDTKP